MTRFKELLQVFYQHKNKKLCNRPKDQITVAELEELKKQLQEKN